MATKEINLPSFAKINLGLRLIGKREDGYHELQTVFQQVSLKDTLRIKIEDSGKFAFKLEVMGEKKLQNDHRNLVWRAAESFFSYTSQPGFSIKIQLDKKIPMGAGLGGGSSNAAVTLLGLNYLFGNKLTISELTVIAKQLGADVTFFLNGGSAMATGIGDQLINLNCLNSFDIVVIYPPVSISTIWAYSNHRIDLTKDRKIINLPKLIHELDFALWRSTLVNDFENIVFKTHPELSRIKQKLYDLGSEYASLSGSGSAIFGIFTERKKAEAAISAFAPPHQGYIITPIQWGLRELIDN